ncbi:efflux RND transporter permease subunit [Desulfothermus okinawensis JCM 13304]
MKPHEFAIKHPWAVLVISLLISIMGIRAFFTMPTEYFPDTHRPQVAVITVEPGASSEDISHRITQVLEKELYSIDKVRKITSSSRDEVSAISVEFEYTKPIAQAVVDVTNAISRVRADLPGDILEPRIYKITDATRPVLTLALSPKKGSNLSLTHIRLLAENQIKDYLLNIDGVSDIDVFGAHKPEIAVILNKDKLDGYKLTYLDVLAAIKKQNIATPSGPIYTKDSEILIKTEGEFSNLDDLKNLTVAKEDNAYILLKDVADVRFSYKDPSSLYHGNFHPAIAINILRPDGGSVINAIKNVKAHLPQMEKMWPQIKFEITDDQEPLIDRNTSGMRSSLYMAIVLTVIIIFLFLADVRASAISLISIPLSFLFGVTLLSLTKYTINIVTLSGLIIATGMVVDATVVVIENINRYKRDYKGDPPTLVRDAVSEILLSIVAGMLTTVVMIVPIMFAGGYVEKVLRQFTLVLALSLVGSLLAAVFVVPPLALKFGSSEGNKKNVLERSVLWFGKLIDKIADGYVALLKVCLRHRFVTMILVVIFFVISVKITIPIIGRELMPPMDTGIMKIFFEISPSAKISEMEKVLTEVENVIKKQKGVMSVSSVVGSEPGEISFGAGGQTKQQAQITINLVTRDKRDKTIWEIEDKIRKELDTIPGIKTYQVYEFGATPMATSRAPIDFVIYGDSPKRLSELADIIKKRMHGVKGLYDFHRSWWLDKPEFRVIVKQRIARYYGVSPEDVAEQLNLQIGGVVPSKFRLKDFLDVPIRISLEDSSIKNKEDLLNLTIFTPRGKVPLRTLADVEFHNVQTVITREDLKNTIDLTGYNRIYRLTQVMEQMKQRLKGLHFPEGYGIKISGTVADMKDSMPRVMKAVVLGFALLIVLLAGTFESFSLPLPILIAIPLAVMGSLWGLLIYNKPMCMPAMMGMLLLAGIVINNSIFLIDFIKQARNKGMERNEALINSVRLRLRPVLMTTISTFVGMLPIIYETAVGLERMSPLGTAAGFGLLVGTVMTMVITPVTYSLLDDLGQFFRK